MVSIISGAYMSAHKLKEGNFSVSKMIMGPGGFFNLYHFDLRILLVCLN